MKQTAEEIQKKCGTIPGELAEIIEKLFTIEPPKFNWKGYLKRFVNNASKIYTKKLRRKNNKRYEGNPGLKIKHKNHVLVGVDTSGSVSSQELVEFMHELGHIIELVIKLQWHNLTHRLQIFLVLILKRTGK